MTHRRNIAVIGLGYADPDAGASAGDQDSSRFAGDGSLSSPRRGGYVKYALFVGKLIVTGVCFWVLFRSINVGEALRRLPTLDYYWAAVALAAIVAQIPLLALRVRAIVEAIGPAPVTLSYPAANAITAISSFFSQVLPGIVGEGVRAWLLVRHGCHWGQALTGVVIDRCIGIALLLAFSLFILLLPSPLNNLSGYRNAVVIGFGGAALVGLLVLLAAPRIVPLLQRRRLFAWIAALIDGAYRALLGRWAPKILGAGLLVHGLSIVAVWANGGALGLSLSALDSAVLFTVMVGVAIVPISVGGWGLRELAVVSLLRAHGLAPEQALLLSLCFGFVLMTSGLLGAIVWLLYPLPGKNAPRLV